jgi:hypothetical protein
MFNIILFFQADESLDLYTYPQLTHYFQLLTYIRDLALRYRPLLNPLPQSHQDANSGKKLLVNGAIFDKTLSEILLITSLDCQ